VGQIGNLRRIANPPAAMRGERPEFQIGPPPFCS
jgi:hypothetical protein